ncbi:MAG: type I DNA topoisomerase [Lachnospiraceae bacterium]|nr:type I DNA topoisomerase [Lachnospiraceae bacterium]MBR6486998.1 type I DNA topoisomerase [Lachnospiraceae bacterium]
MSKNLVIVESPAKVKTIKKFLGSSYEVMASNGHVRDLPKSSLGVDTANDYEPKYITIRGKGDLVAALKKEVKKADKIYLATDPDREGEAISWHLYYALKLEGKKVYRITFNEITKGAIKESFKNAREIDMNLVNAQQARRILDRMVGYRISPLLWAKVKRGLSAGRVQSVALRIICEREDEINAFIPREYWTLDAVLKAGKDKNTVKAHYMGGSDEGNEIPSKEALDKVLANVKNAEFRVTDVKRGERIRKQPLPFTTSTLQQEASKVLNFSTQKTMRIAQQLYEGVDIKGDGTVGVITYLRTDSTRVALEAYNGARKYIEENYGADYTTEDRTEKKDNKKIQDAHEAIRPTDINRTPEAIKASLSRDQYRLYSLIWKRFAASMMSPARYETVNVRIDAAGSRFGASASKMVFDGFMRVYSTDEDKEDNSGSLPDGIKEGAVLKAADFDSRQHFTQPPAHFTEASLVKAMEELGIGRPSTYAPTITTILARRYITKEGRNLYVTELGEVVNQMMVGAFPGIVDKDFTANLEMLLDNVEEGKVDWKTIIRNFYPDLDTAVNEAEKELEKVDIADEVTDEVCDLCGRNMVLKYGPHGKFLACPGFPECRNTKPYLEKIGIKCPKCGKDIVVRKTKKGRRFYGCESGAECEFMSWQKPVATPCAKCGGLMVEKGPKLMCTNPDCGNIVNKPSREKDS